MTLALHSATTSLQIFDCGQYLSTLLVSFGAVNVPVPSSEAHGPFLLVPGILLPPIGITWSRTAQAMRQVALTAPTTALLAVSKFQSTLNGW